jgi:hypothetical protein
MGTRAKTVTAKSALNEKATQLGKAIVVLERDTATRLKRATKATGAVVSAHPLASAGLFVGAGVLVGIAANAALRHKPTVAEVVADALRSGAADAAHQVSAAANRGLRRFHRF